LNRIIVLGDIHAPYESKRAVALAKKVCKAVKPGLIISIGDLVDCYSISDYPRDPARISRLEREVEAAARVIKDFSALADDFQLCSGNHEFRLERYLSVRAPELFGLVTMRELLGLEKSQWHDYREVLKIGKCHFTHEVGYGGLDAARRSLAAFGGNLVFGHTHRPEIVYDSNIRGETHCSMNVGWLGDPNAIDYASVPRVRSWQHGVGLVEQDSTGRSWLQFIPFVNSKCVVQGREIAL